MKRKEKLVIHGNEFYVIDLDCLEKKEKNTLEHKRTTENDTSKNLFSKKKHLEKLQKKDS